MERHEIERRDFPTARRGYEPAAVEEHLRRVADAVEQLRERGHAALSAGASEQVRVILEAAERSAADLRAGAEREAREHVARVEDAARAMVGRLAALDRELQSLLGTLAELRTTAGELAPAREGPEVAAEAVDEPGRRAAADEPVARAAVDEPELPPEDFAADAAGAAEADEAGARLTALNMALSGTPREETARFLAEHYALADPEGLLDDVYARAGG